MSNNSYIGSHCCNCLSRDRYRSHDYSLHYTSGRRRKTHNYSLVGGEVSHMTINLTILVDGEVSPEVDSQIMIQ